MPLSLEEQVHVMTKMKMKNRIEVKAERVVHCSHFPTKTRSP